MRSRCEAVAPLLASRRGSSSTPPSAPTHCYRGSPSAPSPPSRPPASPSASSSTATAVATRARRQRRHPSDRPLPAAAGGVYCNSRSPTRCSGLGRVLACRAVRVARSPCLSRTTRFEWLGGRLRSPRAKRPCPPGDAEPRERACGEQLHFSVSRLAVSQLSGARLCSLFRKYILIYATRYSWAWHRAARAVRPTPYRVLTQ